jgi:hypothetical protein
MVIIGLQQSFLHVDNGMTMEDMLACKQVADRLNEVIIFRSTGSWSMRWIAAGYPTKNFHVKGKSSDWGPQAGFVPYKGEYSKVGRDEVKAREGTAANLDGIVHQFASQVQLRLKLAELMMQVERPAGNPPKRACTDAWPIEKSKDLLLRALRSGDDKPFFFRAVWEKGDIFSLFVYAGKDNAATLRYKIAAAAGVFEPAGFEPLMVMTSSEVGADNRPMTGDYDLMAVCPPWLDYGSASAKAIVKPAVNFGPDSKTVGAHFAAGRNLDKAMDPGTNSGAVGRTVAQGDKMVKATFQGLTKRDAGKNEHKDMGNITGRILRCINALNAEMPNGATALRRVHHNAESHRNHIFGAISGAEMEGGDGVPLTVFQPSSLYQVHSHKDVSPTARFGDVSTFETLAEFKRYASLLHEAGYFVPRNWTWGMSIRDKVGAGEFAALNNIIGGKALIAAARVESYKP